MTAPFETRETAGVLSVPVDMVAYRALNKCEMREVCAKMAACSKSLLVTSPEGLSVETSLCCMSSGKGSLHK